MHGLPVNLHHKLWVTTPHAKVSHQSHPSTSYLSEVVTNLSILPEFDNRTHTCSLARWQEPTILGLTNNRKSPLTFGEPRQSRWICIVDWPWWFMFQWLSWTQASRPPSLVKLLARTKLVSMTPKKCTHAFLLYLTLTQFLFLASGHQPTLFFEGIKWLCGQNIACPDHLTDYGAIHLITICSFSFTHSFG